MIYAYMQVDSLMNPIVTSVRTVSKAVRMETTDYSKPGFNQQSFFDDRTCYNLDVNCVFFRLNRSIIKMVFKFVIGGRQNTSSNLTRVNGRSF